MPVTEIAGGGSLTAQIVSAAASSLLAMGQFTIGAAPADNYWQTLNRLYDAVKAGVFPPDVREQIWADWPTFLGNGTVTVYDPVTGTNRTATGIGRTGTNADMNYVKGRLAVYEQMLSAGGTITDDRLATYKPATGSAAETIPASPIPIPATAGAGTLPVVGGTDNQIGNMAWLLLAAAVLGVFLLSKL